MARLYVKQLLGGRDFGVGDPMASGMENFIYLVGDRDTGECVVIDPAWAVRDIIRYAENDGMKITGALVTHYHPDHCGGSMMGFTIEGLPTLMELAPVPVHVHKAEAHGVRVVTGLSKSDLVEHESNDKIAVGGIEVELLHTPGHTPGSCCFRVPGAVLAGDTLFLQGCGRVDLPGGDKDEMYYTLTQRLSTLPDDLILFPGHAYGGHHAPLGEVRAKNPYLRVADLDQWRRMM